MPKKFRPLYAKWLAKKKAEASAASTGVQSTAEPKKKPAKKSNS